MPNILHFGIGNFHRAHQAWYTQNANAQTKENWRITGVSLRSSAIRDALAPQNFSYTLAVKDAEGTEYLWVDAHDDIYVGDQDGDKIVAHIADPETTVVTITVSEKGYHLDTSGSLDIGTGIVAKELQSGTPQSLIGFLAAGLNARAQSHAPINIVSCDNLPDNGHKLKAAIVKFCSAANFDIDEYLRSNVAFPNTMVDRIVPATTDELRSEVRTKTAKNDTHPIATETFSEWYIEDCFAAPIPNWKRVGVQIVPDVSPFELRKLRMLNGAHSLLAYSGLNAGHQYVHEAIRDPNLLEKIRSFMREASETLPQESRVDSEAYGDALIARFANPNLNHALIQIAMDGSLKLPIRILPIIAHHQACNTICVNAKSALNEWATFAISQLRTGTSLDDPNQCDFAAMAEEISNDDVLAISLMDFLKQM